MSAYFLLASNGGACQQSRGHASGSCQLPVSLQAVAAFRQITRCHVLPHAPKRPHYVFLAPFFLASLGSSCKHAGWGTLLGLFGAAIHQQRRCLTL